MKSRGPSRSLAADTTVTVKREKMQQRLCCQRAVVWCEKHLVWERVFNAELGFVKPEITRLSNNNANQPEEQSCLSTAEI